MYYFNMGINAIKKASFRWLEPLYGLLAIAWVFIAAPLWTNELASLLQGDWADQAVSETLSKKYGSPVMVQNVHFDRWWSLRFGSLTIQSTAGKELIRASGGTLRLRRLDLFRSKSLEMEIRLRGVSFTKEYYRNAPGELSWKNLLRKPIRVEALSLLISKNPSGMEVHVTDCRSKGVKIEGGLQLENSGLRHDGLRVSVSTWTALRSML